mgnify:CR=1 FL=1
MIVTIGEIRSSEEQGPGNWLILAAIAGQGTSSKQLVIFRDVRAWKAGQLIRVQVEPIYDALKAPMADDIEAYKRWCEAVECVMEKVRNS